ncbi:LmeA family phospholipid-binding protein [Actinokineospora sp. NBRC 105648]|uniref:LmeA family phospholipid-binding protein n=1 Tax=Actinokineospora sp. NBRC 105648 TaxID=3032206 RepID=UPI0024A4BCC0|nr:LmeA family phospholipid-binding protein [Actinokineospora sp. NBRC 105648]GLZ37350.1 hypothetical protein Acsp05_09750 [Actinokineospora sp. NBRC 105648]
MLDAAVRAAADRTRGSRVTVRTAAGEVPMTVVDLSSETGTLRLAQGRVDAVRFEAADVAWPGFPVSRLVVSCQDVRFAGPVSTAVSVGSVRVELEVTAEVASAVIAAARPGLTVRCAEVLLVSRRPWPGALELGPSVVDRRALLTPVGVRLGKRRVRLPARVRPVAVDLPQLPRGLVLTGVAVTPTGLRLEGGAVDWRDRLSGMPLLELLSLLANAAATLTVGRI